MVTGALLIKFFLVTIMFISGCSNVQVIGEKIINRDANFSVTKIDSDWQLNIKRSDILIKKINVIMFTNENIDGHLYITSWRLKGEEKLKRIEAYVPEKIIELKKTNTIENWSTKKTTFNNMGAIEITYDGHYKGKDIIFKKDKHLYIIRFLTKPVFYEEGKQFFDKILASFSFTDLRE